ncbi:hypothetical protein GS582_14455 [Rhodococcus hoagii]|nr:hypothetical protein [Prescottella equi]
MLDRFVAVRLPVGLRCSVAELAPPLGICEDRAAHDEHLVGPRVAFAHQVGQRDLRLHLEMAGRPVEELIGGVGLRNYRGVGIGSCAASRSINRRSTSATGSTTGRGVRTAAPPPRIRSRLGRFPARLGRLDEHRARRAVTELDLSDGPGQDARDCVVGLALGDVRVDIERRVDLAG